MPIDHKDFLVDGMDREEATDMCGELNMVFNNYSVGLQAVPKNLNPNDRDDWAVVVEETA